MLGPGKRSEGSQAHCNVPERYSAPVLGTRCARRLSALEPGGKVVHVGGPTLVTQRSPGAAWLTVKIKDAADLTAYAERHPIGLAIVNMESFARPSDFDVWRQREFPGWTIILAISGLSRARTALAWMAEWPLPMVIAPVGISEPEALPSQMLDGIREACCVTPLLVRSLRSPPTPAHFALNAVAVYASPNGAQSLKTLAAQSDLSTRHARRLLRAAGIRSSHRYFSASRVLRSYTAVNRSSGPLRIIAESFGFGSVRTMRREWTDVTGNDIEASVGLRFSRPLVEQLMRKVLHSESLRVDHICPIMAR